MKKYLVVLVILLLVLTSLVFFACDKKITEIPEEEEWEDVIIEEAELVFEPALPGGYLVMIDNLYQARPQSGLVQADLVYEIIAEGGITRYMAMYYSEEAPLIGPVRSARYYFVQLARGMDLPYAHAGGNVDALQLIRQNGTKDMDEIYNSEKSFWRDKSRSAPHNLYTSTELLVEGAEKRGFEPKTPELPPVDREAGGFEGKEVTGESIKISYNTSKDNNRYIVEWKWEADEDGVMRYCRYLNEEQQFTREGEAIWADTIFILTAKTKSVIKEEVQSQLDIVGDGNALRFVNNQFAEGSWSKPKEVLPLVITDKNGIEFKRKEGKLWIQVVPDLSYVEY